MVLAARMTMVAVALAVASLSGPPLAAGWQTPDITSITITPQTAEPGQQLTVRVFCPQDTAVVTSPVTEEAILAPAPDGGLIAETRVGHAAVAGAYSMSVRCGPVVRRVPFLVRASQSHAREAGAMGYLTAASTLLLAAAAAVFGVVRYARLRGTR